MINIGGGPAFILGVAMVLAGVALYALRSMRPELSRDHDIFFAAIALTTGAILMWQGWRLDPFLFLGYLCAAGSATFFGIENIRLRGITTEQAKRSTPITDKGRAVSRRYDYEPQDMDYDPDYDYRPERRLPSREDRDGRRIRATREPRQRYPEEGRRLRRSDDYPDDYQDDYGDRYEGDRYGDAPYRDNRYAQVGAEPPLEAPPRKRRLPRSRRPEPAVRSVPVQDDWDAPDMPTESIGPSSLPPIDSRPIDSRPIDSRPIDSRPIDSRPIDSRPDDRPASPQAKRPDSGGRRPLNVKPAPEGYGSYGDEPPAASSQYADYRPVEDGGEDDEADNSDYQQLY